MSVAANHLTEGGSDVDATSFTTASISPAPNALVLAAVAVAQTGAPTQPTLTGNGLTWVLEDSAAYDITGTFGTLFLFRAMGASPTPGTLVIDFGGVTHLGCVWAIDEFTGVDTSGSDGSGAIVQSVSEVETDLGTTASVTLAAFADAANATYGACAKQTFEDFTPGGGFSVLSDLHIATPVVSILAEWQAANDTVVDCSWATAGEKSGIIGVEIKAGAAPAGSNIQLVVGDAGTPSTTDAIIKTTLEGLGHTVTYVDDDTAENTSGFDGVVLADSCGSGNLGTKYVSVALPLISHEGFYVDTLGMASAEGAVSELNTQIVIVDAAHPFMDGPFGSFSGTLTIQTSAAFAYINDATVDFGAGVDQVAEAPTGTDNKVGFAYESGAAMSVGNAPAKRGYFTYRDTVGAALNADGLNILRNVYEWAFGEGEVESVGYKRLYGPAALSTTAATIYTVPDSVRGQIRHVTINNPTGGEVEVTLSVGADAAGTRLLDQHPIAAGEAYEGRHAINHPLAPGETIQGFSDTAGVVIVVDGHLTAA